MAHDHTSTKRFAHTVKAAPRISIVPMRVLKLSEVPARHWGVCAHDCHGRVRDRQEHPLTPTHVTPRDAFSSRPAPQGSSLIPFEPTEGFKHTQTLPPGSEQASPAALCRTDIRGKGTTLYVLSHQRQVHGPPHINPTYQLVDWERWRAPRVIDTALVVVTIVPFRVRASDLPHRPK